MLMRPGLFAAISLLASFVCAAESAPVRATAVPKVTGPLPVSADSFPFLSAARTLQPIDLAKAGYIEQEFIVSGTANVYDWAPDGSLNVKTANTPYTTRILVRRPADAAKFSGHVVVEPLSTARRFDWAMMDGYLRESILERGDAWVGITVAGSVKALQKFNPTRYAALSFPNPDPTEACAGGGFPPSSPDQEEGLKWDVISQAGAALKSGAMGGLKARYIYMTGQGGDTKTYINAIHPHARLEDGKPVWDGFVVKSPGALGRIRRCAPAVARDDARQATKNAGVPVILVAAQGEVAEDYRRPDSDELQDRFRVYEIAGSAHIDAWAYRELPSMQDQATASGVAAVGSAQWPFPARCEPEILLQTHPLEKFILDSTFANLERWVEKGIAPPKADRIALNGGKVVLDQFGNGTGGIRSPYVDVPVATYFTTVPGPGTCRELGRADSFEISRFEALYGNHKNYVAKVGEAADRMVKEGWLTPSDALKVKAEAASLK